MRVFTLIYLKFPRFTSTFKIVTGKFSPGRLLSDKFPPGLGLGLCLGLGWGQYSGVILQGAIFRLPFKITIIVHFFKY